MKKSAVHSKALRQGGYLAAVTAAVVALVVLINLVVGQLPSNYTEFDLTDNSLYEISDTSKEFLAGLDQDVEIVVLAEEGSTDERILKFLDRYTALSDHLSVTHVDPVAHPETASQYDAQSDSLIVRCADTGKSETIAYSDIITYTYTNYFSMTEDSFDAEGQLTSAVNYVTSEADHTVYTVTGHGEEDLSSTITDAIDKANLNLSSVSPILNGSIPEDCDLLLVNGPATDLSAEELTILQNYLAVGGQMIFIAGDTLDPLPNWEALLESRGFDLVDGYIADLDSYYPPVRLRLRHLRRAGDRKPHRLRRGQQRPHPLYQLPGLPVPGGHRGRRLDHHPLPVHHQPGAGGHRGRHPDLRGLPAGRGVGGG